MPKKRVIVEVSGPLLEGLLCVSREVAENRDVMEKLTDAAVGRRLMAYAIKEHRAGRGPWPTDE